MWKVRYPQKHNQDCHVVLFFFVNLAPKGLLCFQYFKLDDTWNKKLKEFYIESLAYTGSGAWKLCLQNYNFLTYEYHYHSWLTSIQENSPKLDTTIYTDTHSISPTGVTSSSRHLFYSKCDTRRIVLGVRRPKIAKLDVEHQVTLREK